jgi:hypothetical protein
MNILSKSDVLEYIKSLPNGRMFNPDSLTACNRTLFNNPDENPNPKCIYGVLPEDFAPVGQGDVETIFIGTVKFIAPSTRNDSLEAAFRWFDIVQNLGFRYGLDYVGDYDSLPIYMPIDLTFDLVTISGIWITAGDYQIVLQGWEISRL